MNLYSNKSWSKYKWLQDIFTASDLQIPVFKVDMSQSTKLKTVN